MKDFAPIMDEKNALTVGYVSPGWPLSDFPNGIVAYIQNILHGLDVNIKPIILSQTLLGYEPKKDLIDLSSLVPTRRILEKILDKILYNVRLPFLESIQYQRTIGFGAKKLSLAIQNLEMPLNILEMEESFGIAYFLMKTTKIPIVTRIHGPWYIHGPIMQMDGRPGFKARVFYEGEAIKNSHGVTAPSLDVLNRVREYYGIALENAQVIPNPVLEVPIDKRWQYKANSTPFILVVGRFDLHKGGDLAVDAFRLIALKNKTIELLFVGPDRGLMIKNNHLKFNEYIERFIPEEHVKKRIRFLGHCDQAEISKLRKESLVTVVSSRYETFSISLAEALVTGCPVVATNVGAIKELITDGFNGVLAKSESSEDIAEKVLMLIDDPIKMRLLSKNAIEDCKKRFSPDVVAEQTTNYYKSVIARSST